MITKLEAGIMLYHGSYCEVRTPDLSKCQQYRDFGQGFYLTTSFEQAKAFAGLSLNKAITRKVIARDSRLKYVSKFEYVENNELLVKTYDSTDQDWLHCIVAHRRRHTFDSIYNDLKKYDLIAGKVANDDTNATLLAYISQIFGDVGTQRADEMCISLLLPERLKDQYCFRTAKALDNLCFRGSMTV